MWITEGAVLDELCREVEATDVARLSQLLGEEAALAHCVRKYMKRSGVVANVDSLVSELRALKARSPRPRRARVGGL